jgi:UDP-glucose 4-epimerase
MIKVLIIGANSYIGTKFKEYVYNVTMYNLEIDMVSASNGDWKKMNFSEYDTILHLSAIVHKKEKKSMMDLYKKVNYELAVDAAKKAKGSGVGQFIFMSTAAVYGNINGCIMKDTKTNPVTLYGKTKLAAEDEIMKLNDSTYHVAIVRPPMVYGKGCKGNYKRLIKLAKFTPLFPAYHNIRSVIHIDVLSKYILELIINKGKGYLHPQDDEYMDVCEMVKMIREEAGKKTILVSSMNRVIKYLVKYNINPFYKIFGNLYYDKLLY